MKVENESVGMPLAENSADTTHAGDETAVSIQNTFTALKELLDDAHLLGHSPVQAALSAIASSVESARDGVLLTTEEYARQLFSMVTGSRTYADILARRLIHEPNGTVPYILGSEGIVVQEVGSGAFGNVYLVYFYDDRQAYAVKVSKYRGPNAYQEGLPSHKNARRFERDTQITKRHRGRHVLPDFQKEGVVNMSEDPAELRPFFAMEYLRGRSFKDVLQDVEKTGVRLSPQVAINLLAVLIAKISAFDGVHRDVKPDNIFLGDTMNVRLMDAGLAVDLTESARQTQVGDGGIGSPMYMPPIQFTNPAQANKLDDLYAAAAVVYHLVTGKPPVAGKAVELSFFQNDGLRDETEGNMNGRHVPDIPEHLPPPLQTALRSMLRKCRRNRALNPRATDPAEGSVAEDILKEWQAYLADYTTVDDSEDPSIADSPRLPDREQLPDCEVIGSRHTREQVFALLTSGTDTVLQNGELTAPDGSRTRWKIVKWGGAAVLVVGTMIIGTVALLRDPGTKNDAGKSDVPVVINPGVPVTPANPANIAQMSHQDDPVVEPRRIDGIAPEIHHTPFPGSDAVKRSPYPKGFLSVDIGQDPDKMQVFLKYPDEAAATDGKGGQVIGMIFNDAGMQFGAGIMTVHGSGNSYSRPGGSAVRVHADEKNVALMMHRMGVSRSPKDKGSAITMLTLGHDEWLLTYVDGEEASMLTYIGAKPLPKGEQSVLVFPTRNDCRTYLAGKGLILDAAEHFDTAKGPAHDTERGEGRDDLGRSVLNAQESSDSLYELERSLQDFLSIDRTVTGTIKQSVPQ